MTMTNADLQAVLGRLRLSQMGAARLLGVDGRTMRRWLAGEREISEPVARLLDLVEHVPGSLGRLERITAAAASTEGDAP
jgi:DNA-binding transcriptional regulator YiaG